MLNDFIYYTTAAILLYQILRASIYWLNWFAKYMFDEGLDDYNPKLEKPRLFFHLIAITFSVIAFVQLGKPAFNPSFFIFLQFFHLLVVVFFGVMFQITWCKIFKTRFIPQIKEVIRRTNRKPKKIIISDEKIQKIFKGLILYGFISYDDFNEEVLMEKEFISIFSSRKFPDTPLFKLEMDNIQTHVLYKRFNAVGLSVTLDNMTKIFTNVNGIMNAKSISNSSTQKTTDSAKDEELILSIFDNFLILET